MTPPQAAVGTIVAKTHLPYARVLARSLRRHHPELSLHVLLADEVAGCFEPEREPFELLLLRDLEIPGGKSFRFRYAKQPLSYACTPFLLEALLDRAGSRVLFVKQESLVTGSLDPVLEALGRHAIVLTPHLLEPLAGPDCAARELNILQSGVFNIGLLGVSETTTARSFLAWWQDRVRSHCRHAIADGMHYEQRWIDLVPAFFEDVCVLRHSGANVGHWNLPERRSVDVRLLRFSGFDPDRPHAATRYSDRVSLDSLGDLSDSFANYAESLKAEGWDEVQQWPYAYDRFDNGVPVPEAARELYADLDGDAERFGDPFRTGDGSYFAWLNEPVREDPRVTRLWIEIHASRADLRDAFPDPSGADADRFAVWTAASGVAEHAIPEAFVAR